MSQENVTKTAEENGKSQAFPHSMIDPVNMILNVSPGLTKREEIAKAAMVGLLSIFDPYSEIVTALAVELADALLAELAKKARRTGI